VPDRRVSLRDRALLLLGFAGGFRRFELVALNMDDLEFSSVQPDRLTAPDQNGPGGRAARRIGIPYGSSEKTCPVRCVKAWLEAVGLDPDRSAGHSLRAGLATSAAAGGASERDLMNQTGHRSADMVRR
jgi:integrase